MSAQAELFQAPRLPEGFIYLTDFIGAAEEASLLEHVGALPFAEARYRQYTARRRVVYFGHAYDFASNRLGEAPPMPDFLFPLRNKVARWMQLEPEALAHALVNEYRPGTPLGWHRDAPDFDLVAGVSLRSHARSRTGNGSSDHLTAELLWLESGTTGMHVPHKGGGQAI